MKLTRFTLALLSAGTLCAGTSVQAASAKAAKVDPAAKLPMESAQGDVRYVTGGVGHGEALAFERAEKSYPLSLEFAMKARPRDEFVADVSVSIRDANGKTSLDAKSQGPFLLAKLPAGRYDIKATMDGKTLERHATVVDGKSAHVSFVWPQAASGRHG